jgi:hypothetical protein
MDEFPARLRQQQRCDGYENSHGAEHKGQF